MTTCECTHPIPCPDSATCAKCAKPCVAALERVVVRVDPLDELAQYRKRVGLIAALN